MASRRRRRKTIGKVVSDVERRVRVVEKRPGAKRLKRNVVTAEKIQYRTIAAKNITTDGVTPNEVSFGVPVVSDTQPTEYLKSGTLWINPDDGAAAAYDFNTEAFIPITDTAAYTLAAGKNTIYYSSSAPTGGTYAVDDTWFDTDDGYKMYTWTGSAWSGFELGNSALASISAAKISAGSLAANVILTSSITAGQISAGTINAAIEMTSATITGGTIRTANASTTPRIEISSSSANRLSFYGSGTAPGTISVSSHTIYFYPPGSAVGAGANMQIYGDESGVTPNGIFMQGGTSTALTFSMSSTTIALNQGTYGIRINANGVVADGAAGESTEAMRNVRITQTAPTSGASSGTTNGTIVLVREA